ncbi:MAG: carboxypeptidase-like regulatory domain-containing protein [Muribaculaceae bacterium]|nr:carboxypeptidase-like regulatory domain-containing protein [Muribaculaceae bacterium]
MRFLFVIIGLLCALLSGAAVRLTGVVADAVTHQPVEFATVAAQPGNRATATDGHGRFSLTLEPGDYTLAVSFVGYTTHTQRITLIADRHIEVLLRENATVLQEVVVTAKEGTGLTTSSRIDRDAMEHLQPTSLTDLMELLPGNVSQDPDMGGVNSIHLRETGTLGANGTATTNDDYNISALGTLFVVDGAPINGDANLQQVPNADQTSAEHRRDMTNKGVDMRTIGTDNIESVEVVRGIPSVEYGNLTSGMVNIKRTRRATPLTARFKADEYSKLVSVGKGFHLPGADHIMNVDAGYLDSKVDPRNNLENYKRLNLSARLNLRWNRPALTTGWVLGGDYTGSFDDTKTDPDLNYNKVNEYRSRYNRWALTSDLTFLLPRLSWLSSINLNTSVSYQHDRLERRKQVAPQRASVAPTTMSAGVHDGQYLLGEYIADFVSDGRPFNAFVKLKGEGRAATAGVNHAYKAGVEWSLSKNYGNGQEYDLARPLSASWTTRPRAYRDIPALHVLSCYAEDNLTATLHGHTLELQAGLRTQQMPHLDARYALAKKVYIDPRVNAKWSLPEIAVARHTLKAYVAAGYGLTTKMPTIAYLYPQPHYTDFIQLNYYDVNRPEALSRISLRTYIDDATNYQLRAARNRKWEVRLGAQIGRNSLSITYFNESMTSGYRYSSHYQAYEYTKYDANAIKPLTLTAPPVLDDLPSTAVRELAGYRMAANGSRLDKQGVELTLTTARWQPLRTALTVTGAWFRSIYSNSQMLYDPVSVVVDDRAVSDSYIGYYRMDDGRVNEQLNTNFMFDTQITRWGLVFTTTLQCMWFVSTRKLWQNGVPEAYLDAADGLLHPYTEACRSDEMLQHLVREYNDDVFRRQTVPLALYVNLKATKTIGRHIKVAVFVNRLLDHLPDYRSNGLMVRRVTDPYFGMELNFSL